MFLKGKRFYYDKNCTVAIPEQLISKILDDDPFVSEILSNMENYDEDCVIEIAGISGMTFQSSMNAPPLITGYPGYGRQLKPPYYNFGNHLIA